VTVTKEDVEHAGQSVSNGSFEILTECANGGLRKAFSLGSYRLWVEIGFLDIGFCKCKVLLALSSPKRAFLVTSPASVPNVDRDRFLADFLLN
jgi:hypothetical protein